MNPSTRRWLLAGLIAGFVVRCALLAAHPSFDMHDYVRWGTATLDEGLARGYAGIYFPLQYQLLAAAIGLARVAGLAPELAIRFVTLAFDTASAVLLVAILRSLGRSPLPALLYWLHPWFIAVCSLGYVDPQFTFVILFAVWVLLRFPRAGAFATTIAGMGFACALLMKPQAALLVFTLAVYAAFRWTTGDRQAAWLLVPSCGLFLAYEAYFFFSLRASLGFDAAFRLPDFYVRIGSVMPVLTANMLNIWYPVAYVLKGPGAEIWTVSSKLQVLPGLDLRFVALIATVLALVWLARCAAGATQPGALVGLIALEAMLVPMVMTSAHENHLFLATTLLTVVIACTSDRGVQTAGQIVLAVQFLNLEGTYGAGPVASLIRPWFGFGVRACLAIVDVAAMAVVMRALIGDQRWVGRAGNLRI